MEPRQFIYLTKNLIFLFAKDDISCIPVSHPILNLKIEENSIIPHSLYEIGKEQDRIKKEDTTRDYNHNDLNAFLSGF